MCVFTNAHELVAAKPKHNALVADRCLKGTSYSAKRLTSGAVPLLVVQDFQAIDIDEEDREIAALAAGGCNAMFKKSVEPTHVSNAGQFIVQRQLVLFENIDCVEDGPGDVLSEEFGKGDIALGEAVTFAVNKFEDSANSAFEPYGD